MLAFLSRLDRRDRIAGVALAALVAFEHRVALSGQGFYYRRDVHRAWVPQVEAFVKAIASGSWPVWDLSPGFGQPLLADPSAQIAYPLTWLNLILRPWTYYTLFASLHMLLGALGLYALARRLGTSPAGSFVGAGLWAVSGPYVSMTSLWHHYAGASWMPWVLVAVDRLLKRISLQSVLVAGAVLGAQVLAGSADICAMTLVAATIWAAARRIVRPLDHPGALRLAGAACAALVLALGLSAAMWLPALDVLSRSARWSFPSTTRLFWSLHPACLGETLLAGLCSSTPLAPGVRTAVLEGREPFLASLYLGLPALALVAGALATSSHRARWVLAALALLAACMALGRHTPLLGVATWLLPPLRIFRYPVKWSVLLACVWALLAGIGFDAWREPRNALRGRWNALVIAPLVALVVACAAAVLLLRWFPAAVTGSLLDPGPLSTAEAYGKTLLRLEISGALAVLSLALALRRSRHADGRLAVLVAGLALLDVLNVHRQPDPVAPLPLYTHRPDTLLWLHDSHYSRAYVYDYGNPGRTWKGSDQPVGSVARAPLGWDLEAASALGHQVALAPQAAGRWGVSQAFDTDMRGLYLPGLNRITYLLRQVEGTPAYSRLLAIGGVTHVVALHPEAGYGLQLVGEVEGYLRARVRVFLTHNPLPRTYVVGAARSGGDTDALRWLLDPAFRPEAEVVLAEPVREPGQAGPAGTSRIGEYRPDAVRLEVSLDRPGFVVLLEGFEPGWQARLDGRKVPLLRANVAFRAVQAPAGRHEITFVYRPPSLLAGLAISAASLVVGCALLARARAARVPTQGASQSSEALAMTTRPDTGS